MCYWIIPVSGIPISDTTVQHVTTEDLLNLDIKSQVNEFNEKLVELLDDTNHRVKWDLPKSLEDLTFDDPAYGDGSNTPTDKEYGHTLEEEVDDSDLSSYNKFIGTKIRLTDDENNGGNIATVKRRATDFSGRPLGKPHDNPMLDSRIYEVELEDGTVDQYCVNQIAECIWAQVASEGREHLVMHELVDHRKNGRAIPIKRGYTNDRHGVKRPKIPLDGWEVLMKWKDGSTSWVRIKEVKDSNPMELAKYAVANKIHEEPAFKWWLSKVPRRRNRVISKATSKYWRTTHKFGIRVPRSVEEALKLDEQNGNHLWRDAIKKEMAKAAVAYTPMEDMSPDDVRRGKVPEMRGFQEIKCHLVFDVKMDFTRKARFVAGGHMTETPATLTYSSVVARDSVRLAFFIAALNDIDVNSCDIGNAYLHEPCRETVWFKAGIECGEHSGKVMKVVRALYGLKSACASWRSMFSNFIINQLGFTPTRVDSDVYRRKAMKDDGTYYYELMLVYIDDVLLLSNDPKPIFEKIFGTFSLKNDAWGPPTQCLGTKIEKFYFPDGTFAWSMSSDQYVASAVEIVRNLLAEDRREFKVGKKLKGPATTVPSLTQQMNLIGIGRWAVELGRIDIAVEIALMSQYQASPQVGHLEAMYLIFHYLSKHKNWRVVFDPALPEFDESHFRTNADWTEFYHDAVEEDPPGMPEPLGRRAVISAFVDADHAGNKVTRRSHTGVLIFMNNALITTFSKRQNTVESSTFGSELVAMRICRNLLMALRIKLKMFGVPLDGPANVFCDNDGVWKNVSIPESTLNKKHNSINYHVVRESVAAGIMHVAKKDTETNLADGLTKLLSCDRKRDLLFKLAYQR
eukprot:CCRYP_007551-RA/>CCRYP_007551-RA protein AED:0.38 eAED:0.38 QI:0/0/0/1/1/1/2/0/852